MTRIFGAALAAVAIVLTHPPASFPGESANGPRGATPTNLDLLHVVAADAARQAIGEMPVPDNAKMVVLAAESSHPGNWLIDQVVAEALLSRGLRSAANDTLGADRQGWLLSYRIVDLSVNYPAAKRAHVVGEMWVTRAAHAGVSFQLIDRATRRVAWSREVAGSAQDRFPRQELPLVQNDLFPFTKVDLKEADLSRVLEPIIVSGVVGGLIYLFFSNR